MSAAPLPPLALLERFCAVDDPAFFMDAPWRDGPFAYGTNRHWMARMRLEHLGADAFRVEALPTTKGIEAFAEKARKFFEAAPFAELQPLLALECAACDTCNGLGFVVSAMCATCKGTGDVVTRNRWDACKPCKGNGEILTPTAHPITHGGGRCPDCCGTAMAQPYSVADPETLREPIGGSSFSRGYLAFLSRLPGIQFACVPDAQQDPANTVCAAFRFDGGEGVLMPMRPRRAKEA